ncbi:MAG: hypothetical protein JW768_08765 [Chitinispirillaceae bacterium]|nr:hypothetical protein [Chitinispirillaceae bacterium]
MSEVNVRISMANLTQMDRHQSEVHRSPIVHQEQNLEAHRNEAARRLMAPVEPEKTDGKTVDPDARREEEERKRKKKQRRKNQTDDTKTVIKDRGIVIDYRA